MAAKKTTKKASAKKPAAPKITAVNKPMTKSAIVEELAQKTELTKKQVSSVIESYPFSLSDISKNVLPASSPCLGL